MTELLIASDHAGFAMKEQLIRHFSNFKWTDLGPNNDSRVDYPDYADRLIRHLPTIEKSGPLGILLCGSGQGMAMRANRYSHIRAALVWNVESATLSRQHNNANILCLPARFLSPEEAFRCVEIFVSTPFEGGRHEQRIEKLDRSLSN